MPPWELSSVEANTNSIFMFAVMFRNLTLFMVFAEGDELGFV